ncbi:MAG: hypothetical protein Q7T20_05615 [Saprospiraceae bacterium]|nr:hypothetical protein [Saprospiraceae bacterium]
MENFYQNIERYLLGELAGSDLTAFENALQSNADLARSVAHHREMMQRLDAMRVRNKVKSSIIPHRAKSVAMYTSRKFWSLAASLVVLLAAILFFTQPARTHQEIAENESPTILPDTIITPKVETPNPLPDKPQAYQSREKSLKNPKLIALAREYLVQPSQTLVRDASQPDGDTSSKTPAQLAAVAFEKRKFRLATEILKEDSQVLEDENARFIRASARFNIGQISGAAKDFEALKTSFQYQHEARWNFLLCQMAVGNMTTSRTLLAEMVEEKDFPFRAKAVELEGKLLKFR